MPQTCHAWLEDQDRSGSATYLAAVQDDLINTSGDYLQLRHGMSKIAMMYMWSEFAAYPPVICTVDSASIRGNPLRITRGVALNYLNDGQIVDMRNFPNSRIRAGDDVSALYLDGDEAGVAHFGGMVLIVSNAPVPLSAPYPTSLIHRCTTSASTGGSWSTLSLTETDSLPSGDYYLLGARVESATAVAARFIIQGLENRPAVIPTTRSQDSLHPFSRFFGSPIKFSIPGGLPKLEILTSTSETPSDVSLFLYDPKSITAEGVGRG